MGAVGMRLLFGIFLCSGGGLVLSSCPGLHHMQNGRQFFRYGGIYVTFFCNPGFNRYGYRTSSCVSGRWTRDPPVCVAPGCPDVGSVLHGSSTVHNNNSVVRYMCDPGFRLSGSPVIYCNGNSWNDTQPACEESGLVKSKEMHTEMTKSNSLPNLNTLLSMKKLSGNLLKVQHSNTANGSFVKHVPLAEHRTGAVTNTVLTLQHLPTNQPVISKGAPENNTKGIWNGKTASSNNLFNKGSSEDQVKIQPGSVKSIFAHLDLPSLTRTRLPSTWPLHSMLVTQPTPIPSLQTKSSIEFLQPEPPSRIRLTSSKPPSPSSVYSPSLHQPSKSLLQSNSVTNQSIPSPSPTPNDTSSTPSLKQLSNIFHTSSGRKYSPSPVSMQWTSKSSLLEKQSASASSSRSHTFSMTGRTPYPAPVTLKQYGWLRKTVSGIPEESMGKRVDTTASRKQPQKDEVLFNNDSWQMETFRWFTPVVTVDGTSSKPAALLDENVMSSAFPSSKSLRGVSSQDTIFRGADQLKEGYPTVGLEVTSPTTSLPAWSVADVLLPKTGNDFGSSNLPEATHRQSSISKTTIAVPQHVETLSPQTSRSVSDLSAPEGTRPESQSKSNNEPELLIDKVLSSTEPRVSDIAGKMNRLKNSQFIITMRGTQRNIKQAKSHVPGSIATESASPSINSVAVQAQGKQVTLNGSLAANKRNNLTELSGAHDAEPTEPTLQNNLAEISMVDETVMRQVNLPKTIVCPSPPVPDHGTLYFRNLVRPSPWQYKYYIQYSCTPGYTLVRGDQFSFCQHNGTWSGERPVCADVNECAVGLSHCQQICINTFGSYKCGCHSGFQLSRDGQGCADIDECLDVYSRQTQCEWRCLNIQGSFRCVCPRGYILSDNRYHCEDINECNYKNGGCTQLCINTSGGYLCACREGYILNPYNRKNCQVISVPKAILDNHLYTE
ncbi:uncharacterized protein si:dkey-163f14.6 isoform X2 [Pristis pectinata]|uniref:uncharacterized protein si:dkey-163f14.6 isoform X2 n=1 Tax=Pristis pectinata TaxID=685728 RepID=UPI00223CE061|nr:uncharacterized protein si:dkey-163f14.6 isoform X2 [Pristis pectinata]